MKVWMQPTGRLIKGHVLDVDRATFTRALQAYDSLLYTAWNPKKLKGWGCWEIRRKPERLTPVDIEIFEGNTYTFLDAIENPLVNHVLDCAFLNYDQLRKIQTMDTTKENQRYWVDQLEANEKAHVEKLKEAALENRKYAAKQFKREVKDFKEMVASGMNPALIANHWK
jgi:hypothetical protein